MRRLAPWARRTRQHELVLASDQHLLRRPLRSPDCGPRSGRRGTRAHGSWVKDLDLIAVPWRETAIDAQACAEIIAKAIPGEVVGDAEEKPYGRLAWTIYPKYAWGFDRWYVDLSVMPRGVAALGDDTAPASGPGGAAPWSREDVTTESDVAQDTLSSGQGNPSHGEVGHG